MNRVRCRQIVEVSVETDLNNLRFGIIKNVKVTARLFKCMK